MDTGQDLSHHAELTSAERAMNTMEAALKSALGQQRATLEAEAQKDRAKLQRELEAKHTFVKTVVTVERVSADGTMRQVQQQWETSSGIDAEYHLDQYPPYHSRPVMGATITLKLTNPTDTLHLAKVAHNGR
jgi:hypothetical protein